MNLKEIKEPSDQKLFEAIEQENDTGFLTEDLVRVTRAKEGQWSAPMTSEQLVEKIKGLNGGKV